jgi:hypothetical protein
MYGRFIVFLLIGFLHPCSLILTADAIAAGQPAMPGRVVATVTTLEGSVNVSGV